MTDLTTLAAVKAYAGVVGSADDAVLSSLITAYSAWVRSYTNRDFTVSDYDIWRSGRGQTLIMLPQTPVVSVTSLSIDGVSIPAQARFGTYGYRFTPDAIMVDGTEFTHGANNIRIQFSAGFATVPVDIAQAVNEMVGLRYALRDKQGWSSKSLAGETVSLNTKDMPASVATVLKQYRFVVPA